MLVSMLMIVLAFNGGLYLGTILYSAFKTSAISQAFANENGLNRFC